MDQHRLVRLLEKYKNGTCSKEEIKALSDWYDDLNFQQETSESDSPQLAQEMLSEFKYRLNNEEFQQPHKKKSGVGRYAAAIAAVFVGMIVSASIIWYQHSQKTGLELAEATQLQARHNRFVELPDGSRIVLKAGSKLDYYKTFNQETRSVTLVGEAYFDVKHDPSRPFIIHTGSVSTRVLGTAFNIKAYPDQPRITVTVTRGKVRVTDRNQVLAELTPNKQVIFDTGTATALRQDTKASDQIEWVKQNLSFDNEAFDAILAELAERYQTDIRLAHPGLGKCPTTVSFSGAETIEEALKILCLTRSASFKKNNNTYWISGEGCQIKTL